MRPYGRRMHPVPHVERLRAAVIVTISSACGAVERRGANAGVSAATVVGGLPLLTRAVLTLQRTGIRRILILARHDDEPTRRMLSEDRRVTAALRWMPLHEFPLEDERTWEAMSHDVQGPCLVAGVGGIFSVGFVEWLSREVADKGLDPHAVWAFVAEQEQLARPLPSCDLLVLRPSALTKTDHGHGIEPTDPLERAVARAVRSGHLRMIPEPKPSVGLTPARFWYVPVRRRADIHQAERLLCQSLKGPYEGFVDRYLNRRFSYWFTRLFLKLRLTPNAITTLSIIIGLLAAASFATGTYAAALLGSVLFQLSAVVDCCDGEVARLTFRESRFGERLDIFGDNAVHSAIFAGIAWALFRESLSWTPLLLGGAAIVGGWLSVSLVLWAKDRRDRGEWHDPVQASRVKFILKNMATRDFSIILALFAVANLLGVFLTLAAVGSNLFWMATAFITRPRRSQPH